MTEAKTYWGDMAVGAVSAVGAFAFTAEAIKRFAGEFDPRPYHPDEAAGRLI